MHNFEISDKCGELEIAFNPNHSGTASLAAVNKITACSKSKIKTVNYELLKSLFAPIKSNYILKVDVEGFESMVLMEIFKCDFSDFISSIFYEIDEKWENPNVVEDLLRKVGFTRFEIIGDGAHYDVLATRDI